MRSNGTTRAGVAGRYLIFVSTIAVVLGVLALPAAAITFADVTIQKSAVSASIGAGDTAAFTVTVTNIGNRPAADVTVNDVLPDGGLTWAENPDSAACSVVGDVLSCSVLRLDPGASFSVTVEATTPGEACDYTIANTATVAASNEPLPKKNNNSASASISVVCEPPPPGDGCTFTIGFWKTHYPEAWPADVLANGLTLGTVSYTAAQLEDIFNTPPAGNGLITLAHQLIGAKLNIAAGADGSSIQSTIAAADALIGGLVVPPVGSGSLAPGDTSALNDALTDFNEGLTGPGHCDEEEDGGGED
jgi:uncharacterized repeat protein (TIGR01451 family)